MTKSENIPLDSISGFKILPVVLPPVKYIKNVDFSNLSSTTSIHQLFIKENNGLNCETETCEHFIYFKKNDAKNDSKFPKGRTLFLANIPVTTNENHLRRLFRRNGTIESIIWKQPLTVNSVLNADKFSYLSSSLMIALSNQNVKEDDYEAQQEIDTSNEMDYQHFSKSFTWNPRASGAMCHVVFKEREAVDRCLNMKKRKRMWSDQLDEDQLLELEIEKQVPQIFGKQKFDSLDKLQEQDLIDLQRKVDRYLKEFQDAQEQKKKELLAKRNQPDEDGFITVTRARGRRNTNRDTSGATVTAVNPHELKLLKEKKKKTELKNFYRFQIRENKRQEIAELRSKFEQDKQKIERLKSQRRFKPY